MASDVVLRPSDRRRLPRGPHRPGPRLPHQPADGVGAAGRRHPRGRLRGVARARPSTATWRSAACTSPGSTARVVGVAAWRLPGAAAPPDTLPSPAGVLAALVGRARADEILAALGSAARSHPSGPAAYLNYLAVDPDLQGQAIGRRLADAGIAAADDGRPRHLPRHDGSAEPAVLRPAGVRRGGCGGARTGRPHAHGAAPRSGPGELREPHDGVAVGAPVETHESRRPGRLRGA